MNYMILNAKVMNTVDLSYIEMHHYITIIYLYDKIINTFLLKLGSKWL